MVNFHFALRFRFFPAGLLLVVVLCWLAACANAPEPPLDATTRQRIDSISAARIRDLRLVLDSECVQERAIHLPLLMDSIRRVRLREIEEKLRTIPH